MSQWLKLETTVIRLRARDGHVEPALAALVEEGAETVRELAAAVFPVAHAQDDGVPLGGGPHCQDTKSKVSKLQSLLSDRDMRLWWIDMHPRRARCDEDSCNPSP